MTEAPNKLIDDLSQRTKQNIQEAEAWLSLPIEQLNYKPTSEQWSMLECLEHLNRYGNFYHPEIRRRIERAPKLDHPPQFKSGWLGNKFAVSLLPGKPKMSSPSNMNPAGSHLNRAVLSTFLEQQQALLRLLDHARYVDLTRTKTSISLTSWIKLRLGDTFRVIVYHNQRHIEQAKRVYHGQSTGNSIQMA